MTSIDNQTNDSKTNYDNNNHYIITECIQRYIHLQETLYSAKNSSSNFNRLQLEQFCQERIDSYAATKLSTYPTSSSSSLSSLPTTTIIRNREYERQQWVILKAMLEPNLEKRKRQIIRALLYDSAGKRFPFPPALLSYTPLPSSSSSSTSVSSTSNPMNTERMENMIDALLQDDLDKVSRMCLEMGDLMGSLVFASCTKYVGPYKARFEWFLEHHQSPFIRKWIQPLLKAHFYAPEQFDKPWPKKLKQAFLMLSSEDKKEIDGCLLYTASVKKDIVSTDFEKASRALYKAGHIADAYVWGMWLRSTHPWITEMRSSYFKQSNIPCIRDLFSPVYNNYTHEYLLRHVPMEMWRELMILLMSSAHTHEELKTFANSIARRLIHHVSSSTSSYQQSQYPALVCFLIANNIPEYAKLLQQQFAMNHESEYLRFTTNGIGNKTTTTTTTIPSLKNHNHPFQHIKLCFYQHFLEKLYLLKQASSIKNVKNDKDYEILYNHTSDYLRLLQPAPRHLESSSSLMPKPQDIPVWDKNHAQLVMFDCSNDNMVSLLSKHSPSSSTRVIAQTRPLRYYPSDTPLIRFSKQEKRRQEDTVGYENRLLPFQLFLYFKLHLYLSLYDQYHELFDDRQRMLTLDEKHLSLFIYNELPPRHEVTRLFQQTMQHVKQSFDQDWRLFLVQRKSQWRVLKLMTNRPIEQLTWVNPKFPVFSKLTMESNLHHTVMMMNPYNPIEWINTHRNPLNTCFQTCYVSVDHQLNQLGAMNMEFISRLAYYIERHHPYHGLHPCVLTSCGLDDLLLKMGMHPRKWESFASIQMMLTVDFGPLFWFENMPNALTLEKDHVSPQPRSQQHHSTHYSKFTKRTWDCSSCYDEDCRFNLSILGDLAYVAKHSIIPRRRFLALQTFRDYYHYLRRHQRRRLVLSSLSSELL